jgi:hypothetical protein
MSVDKAGTEDSGCYTAICVMDRMKDGTFLIEEIVRGQWGAPTRERIIKQIADHIRDKLKILTRIGEPSRGTDNIEFQRTLRSIYCKAKQIVAAGRANQSCC